MEWLIIAFLVFIIWSEIQERVPADRRARDAEDIGWWLGDTLCALGAIALICALMLLLAR